MTYSIVARDVETGELGVAVQSHWFSVGSVVPWAAPGVGAIATQANAEISYGPRALDLMRVGVDARTALARLKGADPGSNLRQVAVIDTAGDTAVHTGVHCIAHAGDIAGEQVSCQANIMVSESVWPAMLDAYSGERGPLARRLLAALDAGEAQGGDARGRQSAALLVVPATGEPWQQVVSLRVEDHPAPLRELRRLLGVHDAYAQAQVAEALAAAGDHASAAAMFRAAAELAPDNDELRFWGALAAAQAGDLETALVDMRAVIAVRSSWREVLANVPAAVAPAAPAVLEALRRS
jgi:uncharacterized Ntn-hydrolase superfamily protein